MNYWSGGGTALETGGASPGDGLSVRSRLVAASVSWLGCFGQHPHESSALNQVGVVWYLKRFTRWNQPNDDMADRFAYL